MSGELLYGNESWAKKCGSNLNAVRIGCLRNMSGKIRSDRVKSEWVMNKYGLNE